MKKRDLWKPVKQWNSRSDYLGVRPPPRRRLFRWFGSYQWLIIILLWITAVVFGYIGHSRYFDSTGESLSVSEIFYRAIQLFSLETTVTGPAGWELQVARFLAPIVAVYTGILALATIFREQIRLFRLQFLKNHIVICGLGRKGMQLSREFRGNGEQVVVIEQDRNNNMLGLCKENGSIVLIGNAKDGTLLKKAGVRRAKYIISVCGDDGVNAEVAINARKLALNRKGRALSCLVHILDLRLCNLLRRRELIMGRPDTFRLEFFNIFESGARVLLDKYPPFRAIQEGKISRPHVVVVGIGRMGESVVVNCARNWKDNGGRNGKRLLITLIDKKAEKIRDSLRIRYPQMEQTCELETRQMDIMSSDFEKSDFLFDNQDDSDVSIVYICLDGDSAALGAALTLKQRTGSMNIPIIVRMTHDSGLATLLRSENNETEDFIGIHAFGLLDCTCTLDLTFGCTYEILARAIHEDYVRNEKEKGITPEMNPSLVPWRELPENLKESNRNQAEHIRIKLQAIGCDIAITNGWEIQPIEFSPEEIEFMAKMEHERFVRERFREGWKVSTSKNLDKKTSPTLIPWSDLSEEEKDKDRSAVLCISSLLAAARFQLYRL